MQRKLSGSTDAPIAQLVSAGCGITLRRLQIFWVVAHSETLTKAAKQLGVAQPSLSQQLSGLESAVGAQLFDRRSNRMTLTEEGRSILRLAERVLNSMQALEDGVEAMGQGARQTIRLAGLSSILRVLLPRALSAVHAAMPEAEFDIHDSAPTEVLDLLYGRHINLGLIASNSIASASAGFHQVPIMADPLVLVVPERLRLEDARKGETDFAPEDRAMLNRTIQFSFGTQYSERVQAWYDRALPQNALFARVRSYESAIAMVQQNLGVCLAPALSTLVGGKPSGNVRLYRVDLEPRNIVALVAPQYLHNPAYTTLIEALQAAGAECDLPPVHDLPRFMVNAL
ncbi:LysR family transcriptional regulator [Roseovarius sp. M141]|uniref:LysR family transcriptional regulator n=1 Tax=Roseovarius sp. M141 TaxID=2583806 RepID=UPI0020CDB7A9|nr:LysR family transcriptional regulator [Roseovarius sp. M141]MCQ0093104.1 LysR family transcriptional regulator [Roseovarius sp. M141]